MAKSRLPPAGQATVAPQTKALADVVELVSPNGVPSVLPAVTNGSIYVRSKVNFRNKMTPGRRPRIGDSSLSQGVSPLIPINTHMGRDPTKSDFAATMTQEDKPLNNVCLLIKVPIPFGCSCLLIM
ncbi:hypothetical protein Pcinc_014321 [Petrolisthes cinctipes]|uniref:Uncharacterized protein n=1 Tax=Petrolisthes cinctipes TaxID=88211 RepID=A0AAE1FWP0_PETCI|nr:hypothetical protein Pcinc_014321 [Petrolisthes cinctipes]